MATNDFQPFAYGGAANVVSQSAYLALTTILQNGFSSGVAQSAQLNKVWRQSSIMAAVLAQFSSDYSGQNSTDDGTTATLETNLIAAIRSVTKTGVILADTGAANAYTAVNVPPLVAGTWIDGVVQQVKIAHANTGASTYAPDGLTAIPIYGLGLQPLQGGEMFAGGTAVLMHATIAGVNGGNPICVLMECAGGAQQIAPATQSQHAVQLGQLGRYTGFVSLTGAATLTNANAGNFIDVNSSSAFTVTLPLGSAMPAAGTQITFQNEGSANVTIQRQGSDNLTVNGTNVTSIVLKSGDTLMAVSNGGTTWSLSGSATLGSSGQFAANFNATAGHSYLPNGMLIQWGTFNTSGTAGNAVAVTFDITFPNAVLSLALAPFGTTSTTFSAWYDTLAATGFNGHGNNLAAPVRYIAIGF